MLLRVNQLDGHLVYEVVSYYGGKSTQKYQV